VTGGLARPKGGVLPRALSVVVATIFVVSCGGGSGGTEFALPPPGGGQLDFEKFDGGWRTELDDFDVERRDGDSWYEAFLAGPDGQVSVGTFNEGDASVLWAGVSPRTHPDFVVVAQPDGDEVVRIDISTADR
jgi:hypothetical protein